MWPISQALWYLVSFCAPYSPVLHVGVAPNGLLHVGMSMWSLAGPGALPILHRALGGVVTVSPMSNTTTTSSSAATSSWSTTAASTSSSTTATSTSSTASSRRWGGAKATESVLAATLQVVLSACEGDLHPDLCSDLQRQSRDVGRVFVWGAEENGQ